MKTDASVELGHLLTFSIHLPGIAVPIHIHARVLWKREYGAAGCQIVNMPPVDRELFRDWLKAHVRLKQPLVAT